MSGPLEGARWAWFALRGAGEQQGEAWVCGTWYPQPTIRWSGQAEQMLGCPRASRPPKCSAWGLASRGAPEDAAPP